MARKKILITSGIVVIIIVVIASVMIFRGRHTTTSATLTTSAETPAVDLANNYENNDSRYSIKYPSDWEFDVPGKGTVVFSGKKDTPAFYSTVNIQTVLTKSTGGDYKTVNEFIGDIKKQAEKQFTETSFLEKGPFSLNQKDGTELKGEFVTFNYKYNGIPFKQWQIVVLRGDGQVFYAWAYTSPQELYENNLLIAKAMLKSWSIY